MAAGGELEALLGPLDASIKKTLIGYTRAWVKSLSFGAAGESRAAAGNFRGVLVPYTTHASANQEVAVAHGLERVPRLVLQCLAPNTVNATSPVLTISRAADSTNVYITSATTEASGHLYVE